ncbi:MAG TPA: hypothetical protein VMQ62_07355 [Dongiaceae bacterium]|nr:hypothetical protein [Dongiaceae bacterium]
MIAQSRRGALSPAGAPGAAALLLAGAALLAGCGRAPRTPPSERPLFVSDRGGAARLYEADDEAGSVTLVGSGDAGDAGYVDSMPARLPDGRIIFVSTRGGGAALYVADAGSAGARPLFGGGAAVAADSDPAPCGADRILFARAAVAGTPRDLWVARLDGSDAHPLTRAPSDDGAPCLLPDRRTVIFVSDRGGAPRLHRLDLDAADPDAGATLLSTGETSAPDAIDSAPACLDDGSILFARSMKGQPRQVLALAPDARPPVLRQLTEAAVLPYGAGEPVPIGDGKFLLTAGPGKGPAGRPRYGLYRLTRGGYNLARITRDGAGYNDYARGLELLR